MPAAVQVNPAYQPSYLACQVAVPSTSQQSLVLNISLLPRSAGVVESLAIGPQNQEVEIGAQVQFVSSIQTSSSATGLTPTWFSLGEAGEIGPSGLFVTDHVGESTVYASVGTRYTSTKLTVLEQRGPAVLEVLVDPTVLPPTGGEIAVTAPIGDAQGVRLAEALVFAPDGTFVKRTMSLVAGSSYNGNLRATYQVPANNNVPDPKGVQATQRYRCGSARWTRPGA